ncbi:MAG: penicillin-binding protein 2 [Dysgonamonadaceae bacterium]|jgi:penicillin-binding protein 2|nr:penicillin-binding protein 2 [Dysgonamonadaceae bacterium]
MNLDFDKRRRLIILFITLIVLIYIIRLFNLQVLNSDYKTWADSNAFLKKTLFPSRGVLYDRNDKLLVYNQPAHDIMVVMRETTSFDTLAFCKAINITPADFKKRISEIKNKFLNPGYSSYTPQTFMSQLENKEYGVLQESIYKFPGFYIQNRTVRKYNYRNAAHLLGYIAEADKQDIANDNYYARGDYIGKTGIEKSYESCLRGEKGVEILLRDAHGRIKGKYEDGLSDVAPVSGKDLTLSIDIDLQAYGEELMKNKLGSIIMIQPKTGEILCMVSSPAYDPSILVGRQFGSNFLELTKNPYMPLINRAINGAYPPGSTFKPAHSLIFLQENIISENTAYSCIGGFPIGGHPACHAHASPLSLTSAIANSCNAYFCWGLKALLENRKYGSRDAAMDKWRDYMVAQGFGYPLGVDLPGEKRGLIPNSQFYRKIYNDRWNALTIISIAIGQGEILLSPLQICNLAATIANRGYYYPPHIVKEIKDVALDGLYLHPRKTGIETEHYESIVKGMRSAVTGGTCRGVNISDIEVCGKTGTSENKGKDHSIFMAFAPKDDPQVAIAVLVENAGYGATYAGPIARLMILKAIKGEIPESDLGLEQRIKNTVILPNVVQKN